VQKIFKIVLAKAFDLKVRNAPQEVRVLLALVVSHRVRFRLEVVDCGGSSRSQDRLRRTPEGRNRKGAQTATHAHLIRKALTGSVSYQRSRRSESLYFSTLTFDRPTYPPSFIQPARTSSSEFRDCVRDRYPDQTP
jgi:hypothetical protein